MPPKIRTAIPEDCAPILALMTEVIRATVEDAHQLDTIENVSGNLEHWKENPNRCVHLVAEIDAAIVGVILIKEFWDLCSLFVDTSEHRKGIGRMLTQEAINSCRGRSPYDAIFLNSSPFATSFYAALGFVPRESEQTLHPGVTPMRYDLTGSRE